MGPHEKAVNDSIAFFKDLLSIAREIAPEQPQVGGKYHLTILALENVLPRARALDEEVSQFDNESLPDGVAEAEPTA